jgi:hypothetical protein
MKIDGNEEVGTEGAGAGAGSSAETSRTRNAVLMRNARARRWSWVFMVFRAVYWENSIPLLSFSQVDLIAITAKIPAAKFCKSNFLCSDRFCVRLILQTYQALN